MKYDLTVDSQATKEYVAEEILGWEIVKSNTSQGYKSGWLSLSRRFYGTLPDFLHLAEWMGPLWMKLDKLCKEKGLLMEKHHNIVTFRNEITITNLGSGAILESDPRYRPVSSTSFNYFSGTLPNIAIAQAIQAVQEKK